ncbi:MAG: 50S ribosomal protein L9 [Lachnospiraceae bacterium]
MKIILLEDVKSLGKKGQLLEVNDGYARNFILKKKLGMEATGKNMNDLKLKKANEERIAKEQLEEAKVLAKNLEAGQVQLSMKTGEGGKTFGAVSSKEIATAVAEQLGYDVDKKKIQLKETIKTLGTHVVPIKVHKDVVAEVKVVVTEA